MSPDPTSTPIPIRPSSSKEEYKEAPAPHPKPDIPKIKLRLKVADISHPGSSIFFRNTNPVLALSDAVTSVLQTLYASKKTMPPTRSVTLVLRSMDGVAYTTGSDLDNDHKEIHFNLNYIAGIPSEPSNRQKDEIAGVLTHEMVHAWQWNGFGTAPGGLIEGIADFVRLRADLSPPHWSKEAGGDWDAGYQHTGYFLDWIDGKFGQGSVIRMNEKLRIGKYEEKEFWNSLFNRTVDSLWAEYSEKLKGSQ